MRILLMVALCCCSLFAQAQIQTRPIPKTLPAGVPAKNIQAFQIFDAQGKKVSYEQFLKAITAKLQKSAPQPSVVLFGELHDNPIVHWLQYQTTSDLFRVTPYMVLGAEMFETDQQSALNEYLNPTDTSAKTSTVVTPMGTVMGGDPVYDKFKKSTKLWPNFYTDYKPLVDFAKEHQLPFIATNIPRKYASLVYRGGFAALDTLPAEKKTLFPTMPVAYDSTLGCYAEIFKATGGHGGQNLPKSQAVKDATMAWKIFTNLPNIHYGEQVVPVSSSSRPKAALFKYPAGVGPASVPAQTWGTSRLNGAVVDIVVPSKSPSRGLTVSSKPNAQLIRLVPLAPVSASELVAAMKRVPAVVT